jgi:hypothetical protein
MNKTKTLKIMFVQRDFNHKEIDDFRLNVVKHLAIGIVAKEQYDDLGIMLGWEIHQVA